MSMNEEMITLLESSYNLSVTKRDNLVFSCPATELLDESKMKQLLELYTPMVKGKDPSVGEVYMAGWFRGPMLGLIYMLSAWNKAPDLSLSNLTVQIYKAVYNESEYYACSFLIHNFDLLEPAEKSDNMAWTKETLCGYFEHTVRPVFESIAKVGSLLVGMLWSQLTTSLEYGYERLMNAEESEQVKQQAVRNYGLVKSLDGSVFGRNKNPLDVKFRLIESMDNPDKQVRMKSACCLYYLVDGGYYCYTCPKLKEAERAERREAYRSEKQA